MCGSGYTSGNTSSGRNSDTAGRRKGETHPTRRVALSVSAVTIPVGVTRSCTSVGPRPGSVLTTPAGSTPFRGLVSVSHGVPRRSTRRAVAAQINERPADATVAAIPGRPWPAAVEKRLSSLSPQLALALVGAQGEVDGLPRAPEPRWQLERLQAPVSPQRRVESPPPAPAGWPPASAALAADPLPVRTARRRAARLLRLGADTR